MIIKKGLLALIISIFVITVIVTVYAKGSEIINEPSVKWVSNTEYWQDDYASTIVRLTDYKGNAFNIDSCTVKILKPDKTILTNNAPLSQSGITGNWYRTDSLLGQSEGTYEQEVTCVYNGDQQIKTSQSFHLNPALNYIKTVDDNLLATGASLTNLDLEIKAQISNSTDSINTQIQSTETDLNTLITGARSQILTEIQNHDASIDSQLTNLNMTLTATIGDTENTISAQLTDVNSTLVSLLNSIRSEVLNTMTPFLEEINQTSSNIYTDTQWLVLNAMNQADKSEIDSRFDTLDNNIAIVQQFCSNTQTQNSDLCQEIDTIISVMNTVRSEQTNYFNTLDATTTNTFNLLSGTITENINDILQGIGLLQETSENINATVNAIREDQINQVVIRVLS
jgi:hypothetical protein